LYFEEDDFDGFLEKLKTFQDIEYVHPPKKQSWQQRAVRFYDPDKHIIEVRESMVVVAKRFLDQAYLLKKQPKSSSIPWDS
jgi:capsular polysaccharide biosynthesis protein